MVLEAASEPAAAAAGLRALARGWRRRCPNCGGGSLFVTGLRLRDRCDRCDWEFLQNQGDAWGFMLMLDRAVLIFPLIVMLYFRAYAQLAIFWIIALLMVAGFVYTTGRRLGVCVAADYLVRVRLHRPGDGGVEL